MTSLPNGSGDSKRPWQLHEPRECRCKKDLEAGAQAATSCEDDLQRDVGHNRSAHRLGGCGERAHMMASQAR